MEKFLKKLFIGGLYTSYTLLLAYSLFNLKTVTPENTLLLLALTYYVNKHKLIQKSNS